VNLPIAARQADIDGEFGRRRRKAQAAGDREVTARTTWTCPFEPHAQACGIPEHVFSDFWSRVARTIDAGTLLPARGGDRRDDVADALDRSDALGHLERGIVSGPGAGGPS
jgi:hypothetical protein